MTRRTLIAVTLTGALLLGGCSDSDTVITTVSPTASGGIDRSYLDPSLPIAARVEVLLGQMTQAEKFGQMTQVEEHSLLVGDVCLLYTSDAADE